MRITLTLALGLLAFSGAPFAQGRTPATKGDAPWFGLTLPPRMSAAPAVRVGERAPRPASMPSGDPTAPEFLGAAIKADVETIVSFSKDSRARKEMGGDQMWGRVAGFPSGHAGRC